MVEVTLNPLAEAEFDHAYGWYRDRDAAAAKGFVTAFDRAIEMLGVFPEIGAPCDERCRFWALRKYPYGLVYFYDGTAVRVVSVTHDHQLPGYWADRT